MRATLPFLGLRDAMEKISSVVIFSPLAGGTLLPTLYTEPTLILQAQAEKEKKILAQLLKDKEVKGRKALKDLKVVKRKGLKDNAFFEYAEEKGVPPRLIFGVDTYDDGKSLAGNPGTVAHELGHAIDWAEQKDKKLANTFDDVMHLTSSSGAVPVGTFLGFGGEADPSTLALAGLIGSALNYRQLRNEIVASAKGYDLLRRAGKGRWEALSAYSGVPSYALGTLGANFAPAATLALL